MPGTTATQEAPTKAPKDAFIVLPYNERSENRYALAWREVKMLWPRCDLCQKTGRKQWWLNCSHHPYTSNVAEPVETPVVVCAVCSERVEDGAISHCDQQDFLQTGTETRPKVRIQSDTRGVRMDESANAGRSVEVARSKGAILPSENDPPIAAMCEFSRCYRPVITRDGKRQPGSVWTEWGVFCSEAEAKLVAIVGGGEAVEILHTGKQIKQLREISL